jgi:hypothetical protein
MLQLDVRSKILSAVAVVALMVTVAAVSRPVGTTNATDIQRIDPIRPPVSRPAERLSLDDLVYVGGFRVPEESNGESFSYGGQTLAYDPGADALFIGSMHSKVAEVSIPAPVKGSRADELPVASVVQGFSDPTDGHMRDIAEDGVRLAGLLVQDERLYGTGVIYYDAGNSQRVSHFSRSLELARGEVSGVHQVGETGKSGFVAGYMATVPPEWRAALGGPAVTGQCCISIISRTSFGPALFAWDPADLNRREVVPAKALVYYPQQHATLGPWEGTNDIFGGTTEVAGVVIVDRTRTVLFAGRNGMGPFCYGQGTADEHKASERQSDGEKFCYDPTSTDKGQHAFPYRLQFWAYDINDLAAVRAGDKDPWEVRPYGVWPFELPAIGDPHPRIGAVAYDPARRRIFMTQLYGEKDGYALRPIIHVFTVKER